LIEKGVYIQPPVPSTPPPEVLGGNNPIAGAGDETAAELPAEKPAYTEPALIQPDAKEKLYMYSQKPVLSSKLPTTIPSQHPAYTVFNDMNRQRVIVLQVCLKLAVDTVNAYSEPVVGDRATAITGVADQYYDFIKKKLEAEL
jgi:hypothetical protein